MPARFPVHVGDTKANLLLPIYGVVAVAALALAWDLFGDGQGPRQLGPLAWPLALFVGWVGLSFLWTKDVRQGAIELGFFVLPFGLLAVVLARLRWSRAWVLTLYVQLAFMGLLFALIGVWQYHSRNIFWNPKVRVDNAYAPSGFGSTASTRCSTTRRSTVGSSSSRSSRASRSCCSVAATRSGSSPSLW